MTTTINSQIIFLAMFFASSGVILSPVCKWPKLGGGDWCRWGTKMLSYCLNTILAFSEYKNYLFVKILLPNVWHLNCLRKYNFLFAANCCHFLMQKWTRLYCRYNCNKLQPQPNNCSRVGWLPFFLHVSFWFLSIHENTGCRTLLS
jgi:hypothetical protein